MKKLLEWSGHGGKVEIVPALFAPLDLELIALVILFGIGSWEVQWIFLRTRKYTDDQDHVDPMSSGEEPADGIADASIRPAGMYYYSSAFFFSSHHLFLIRHVAI